MAAKKESPDSGVGNATVRSLSSLVVGKVSAIILTGLTFIIVARLLGASQYGVYTLAIGYASLMGAVGNFGIGSYLNKHLAEAKHKKDGRLLSKMLVNSYAVIIPVAIGFALLGVALSGYAATALGMKISQYSLLLASAAVFFSMVFAVGYSAMVGIGKSRGAAIATIVSDIFMLTISIALILAGYGANGAVIGLLVSYVIGAVATMVMLFAEARRMKGYAIRMPRWPDLRSVLGFSLPIAANTIANTTGINNFAVLLLGVYATTSTVGNYGAAYNGFNLVVVFYATITTALLPTISVAIMKLKNNAKGSREGMQKLYSKTLMYSLLVMLPLVVFVITFAKDIIFIFISSSYPQAPEYLGLILVGVIVNLLALFTANFFTAAGKVYEVLKYSMISTAAELAALIVLVPVFQTIGLIIAIFYVGNIIDDFNFIRGAKRIFGIETDIKGILAALGAAVVSALLIEAGMFLTQNIIIEVMVAVVAVCIVYPVLLIFAGLINSEVIGDVARATRKIKLIERAGDVFVAYLETLIRICGVR